MRAEYRRSDASEYGATAVPPSERGTVTYRDDAVIDTWSSRVRNNRSPYGATFLRI